MLSGLRRIRTFNSRPHEEVDPQPIAFDGSDLIFQFTTSRGGRHLMYGATFCCSLSFNSRPHEEVDVIHIHIISLEKIFQFTTSRGGRRLMQTLLSNTLVLSIHDLTRRSTFPIIFFDAPRDFQFTTSRGGRRTIRMGTRSRATFNSRPHEEVDVSVTADDISIRDLSIHDLTRRSTSSDTPSPHRACPFNSRPHEEVDETVW